MSDFSLSIIIPVYNEEKVLEELIKRIKKTMSQVSCRYSVLFVDDGSTDRTLDILRQMSQQDDIIKVISLSRNFGHQVALAAGLHHFSGDAAIVMDADLQDPVDMILKFLGKWREGYHIVYGVRTERKGEGFLKKATAFLFYKLFNFLSDTHIPENVSDFRLLDKKVVECLKAMPEKNPVWRGMMSWVGFRSIGIPFVREPRYAGTTHYPFKRMFRLAFDAITSFSFQPLRLATYFGFTVAVVSFLMGIYTLLQKFIFQITLKGWASLMTAILFLGGIQLIMIGVMGEYIGRTYEESKNRPLYFIKEKINF